MTTSRAKFDTIIVGAGFAGLYAVYKMRRIGLSVRAFERGEGVGGVWYWNRYPGARCDVESLQYSYSFDPELEKAWVWPERYSPQPDILRYAEFVADRYDLKKDIQFGTEVHGAVYDEAANRWIVRTSAGEFECQYLIMASGGLSTTQVPTFPGQEDFQGPVLVPGAWPRDPVDLAGKNVAVVGTGSSAIQIIPAVAKVANQVTVFQRTPNFSVPMRNKPLTPEARKAWLDDLQGNREKQKKSRAGQIFEINDRRACEMTPEEREAEMARRWEGGSPNFTRAFADFLTDLTANGYAAEFVHRKIKEIVKDPETAEKLCPKDHPIGAKRICVDTDYYETYNRPNVDLVDLRSEPLEHVSRHGIVTSRREYPADVLILATGYDAVTGPLLAIDIRGAGGLALREAWAHGPRAYLGLMSAGFPNLFMITGPGSPSVSVNVICAIEQHVDFVADIVNEMRSRGADRIEPDVEAQDDWVELVRQIADSTLFPKANSFYMGANIPGKPRVFLLFGGGLEDYTERCRRIAQNGYEGFRITAVEAARPKGGLERA